MSGNDTFVNEHHRAFKDQLYEQFASIGKAVASPRRIEIIDLLAQGERSVEALAEQLGQSLANTSQHLQVLRSARLVDVRREGLHAYYRLADDAVFSVWKAIRDLGQARITDVGRLVEQFATDRGGLEALSAPQLLERLQDDDVTLVDVRPEEEYRAGHIPGALSIPLQLLESCLQELPRKGEIVAYCRGPFCLFSDEAVDLLRRHGFEARRLEHGLPDWRSMGLPVESSA